MKMLTEKIATEIGGALQRIEELSTKTIVEQSDASERRGLEQYLSRILPEHALELISCWFTIQRQYKPLIQGFAGLLANAEASLRRAQTSEPEPTKAEEAKP